MDINIIAGKCSEMSLKYVINELKNRDKNKKHIIIAPDRSLFSLEERLFDELKESCFFDINVISFSRYSRIILDKLPTQNVLSKQSGVALIKKLLIENQNNLLSFGKTTNYLGFANSLFETICLYKSCNILPEDMVVTDDNNYANLKQKDIKLIYSKYEKFLQNEYTDSFNQLRLFESHINAELCKDTCFYFVEFDSFTNIMYDIICKLSRFAMKTFITCNYSKGMNNSNIYSNKVYYDLIDLFKYNGLAFNVKYLNSFSDKNMDLMLSNAFAYNPINANEKNDDLNIISFDNVNDEIKYICAHIYDQMRNDNTLNYGDFAVVLSDQMYFDKFKQELNYYNIPYYLDTSKVLITHTLIRTIFDICQILIADFEIYDFSNLIKSSFMGFDKDQVLSLDNKLKKRSLHGMANINPNLTEDKALAEFMDKILEWKNSLKDCHSNADFLERIILSIKDYLMSRATIYLNSLNPLDYREYAKVEKKFDSITKDFLNVFGSEFVEFRDFLETLKSYFENTSVSLPPITSNTLFVADFNVSYISKHKFIYILGCNEGKLPKFSSDNGLVTDEELLRLPNAKQLSPTIAMINQRKTFKLFDMIFRYERKLIISYATGGIEGKMYPNNLVLTLLKIFGNQLVFGSSALDLINSSYIQLKPEIVLFNNQTQKKIITNILNLIKDWDIYADNLNYRQILSSLIHACDHTNLEKLISNNNNNIHSLILENSELFQNNSTSVSQIETYYSCPYKHFAKYGLKIEKNKDSKLEPVDIGNIIHAVLKSLMGVILKNLNDLPLIQSKSKNLLDKFLSMPKYSEIINNPANKYIIKALYKEIDRVCVGLVNEIKSSNFQPNIKYLEYSFKPENLVIDEICIRGNIDRVDTYLDGFLVIDYKTGETIFDNYNDVCSGKKLQLLVYAKAFEIETKKTCKGAFYLPLSNDIKKSATEYKFSGVMNGEKDNLIAIDNNLIHTNYKSSIVNLSTNKTGEFLKNKCHDNLCISKEDFDYLLNFAIKQVKIAISNIKKGNITPNPLRNGRTKSCTYCDYKGLCNYLDNFDRYEPSASNIEDIKNLEINNGI